MSEYCDFASTTLNFSAKEGKYIINEQVAPVLKLIPGMEYKITMTKDVYDNHPLLISMEAPEEEKTKKSIHNLLILEEPKDGKYNATLNLNNYMTQDFHFNKSFLFSYKCQNHEGMGNTIEIGETNGIQLFHNEINFKENFLNIKFMGFCGTSFRQNSYSVYMTNDKLNTFKSIKEYNGIMTISDSFYNIYKVVDVQLCSDKIIFHIPFKNIKKILHSRIFVDLNILLE